MPKMVIEVPEQFVEVGKAMAEHLAMLQRTVDRLGGGRRWIMRRPKRRSRKGRKMGRVCTATMALVASQRRHDCLHTGCPGQN